MKGRTVPILVTPPLTGDPSMAVDEAYFRRNPHLREYTRAALSGELPDGLPPGTKVHVRRVGALRIRGFAPPREGLN